MSGMTHDERVVGALIPTVPHRPKPLPIPLALLPGPPRPSSTLIFDMARPDLSGRISIRGLLGALAWTSDVRLDLAITTEMMIFAVRVAGQHGVAGSGTIKLPSPARRLVGLVPGEPVLIAACPSEDLLLIIPTGVVDHWLRHSFAESRTMR